MKHKRVETFMTAWSVGQDLQHVIQLAEEGQLDAQIGYRDWWHDFDAAIEALLGHKVAGNVTLAVS